MKVKRKIRNSIGWFLATLLAATGNIRKAKQESFQEGVITSVYFHNPGRSLFQKMVLWFKKNGYVFLTSEQMIQILNKQMPCPSGALWISLDDGWKDNIENVVPVAVEHDIPITIFVCTASVEEGTFWWLKIQQSRQFLPAEFRDIRKIFQLPESSRKRVIEDINRVTPSFRRVAMTVEDVKAIAEIRQITLGAHTVSHPVLPNCTDEEMDYELVESKKRLENWTGKAIRTFAYPGGFFSGREKSLLLARGYELAATTKNEKAGPDSDRYLVPRRGVMDDGSFTENLCHALGIWEPLINKLKKIVPLR